MVQSIQVTNQGSGFTNGQSVELRKDSATGTALDVSFTVQNTQHLMNARQSVNTADDASKLGSGYSVGDVLTIEGKEDAHTYTQRSTLVALQNTDIFSTLSEVTVGENNGGSGYSAGDVVGVKEHAGNTLMGTFTLQASDLIEQADVVQAMDRGSGYKVGNVLTLRNQANDADIDVKVTLSSDDITDLNTSMALHSTDRGSGITLSGDKKLTIAGVTDPYGNTGENMEIQLQDSDIQSTISSVSVKDGALDNAGSGYAAGDALQVKNSAGNGTLGTYALTAGDIKSTVSSFVPSNRGSGYKIGDEIDIQESGTSYAKKTLVAGDFSGHVTSLSLEAEGTGYRAGNKVSILGGGNGATHAIQEITLGNEHVLNRLNGFTVANLANAGSGYQEGDLINIQDIGGSGFHVDDASIMTTVSKFLIDGSNSGLQTGDVLTLKNKANNVTLLSHTLAADDLYNKVTTLTVDSNNLGSGYADDATLFVKNAAGNTTNQGENKVATVTLPAAKIQSTVSTITFTSPGSGYDYGDTLKIRNANDNGWMTPTFTLTKADIQSKITELTLDSNNGGTGYTLNDTLTIQDDLSIELLTTDGLTADNLMGLVTQVTVDSNNLGSGYASGNTIQLNYSSSVPDSRETGDLTLTDGDVMETLNKLTALQVTNNDDPDDQAMIMEDNYVARVFIDDSDGVRRGVLEYDLIKTGASPEVSNGVLADNKPFDLSTGGNNDRNAIFRAVKRTGSGLQIKVWGTFTPGGNNIPTIRGIIEAAGTGYAVNDIAWIKKTSQEKKQLRFRVTAIGANGAVTGIQYYDPHGRKSGGAVADGYTTGVTYDTYNVYEYQAYNHASQQIINSALTLQTKENNGSLDFTKDKLFGGELVNVTRAPSGAQVSFSAFDGNINNVSIISGGSGGSGYKVNDILVFPLASAYYNTLKLKVTSVNNFGRVTGVAFHSHDFEGNVGIITYDGQVSSNGQSYQANTTYTALPLELTVNNEHSWKIAADADSVSGHIKTGTQFTGLTTAKNLRHADMFTANQVRDIVNTNGGSGSDAKFTIDTVGYKGKIVGTLTVDKTFDSYIDIALRINNSWTTSRATSTSGSGSGAKITITGKTEGMLKQHAKTLTGFTAQANTVDFTQNATRAVGDDSGIVIGTGGEAQLTATVVRHIKSGETFSGQPVQNYNDSADFTQGETRGSVDPSGNGSGAQFTLTSTAKNYMTGEYTIASPVQVQSSTIGTMVNSNGADVNEAANSRRFVANTAYTLAVTRDGGGFNGTAPKVELGPNNGTARVVERHIKHGSELALTVNGTAAPVGANNQTNRMKKVIRQFAGNDTNTVFHPENHDVDDYKNGETRFNVVPIFASNRNLPQTRFQCTINAVEAYISSTLPTLAQISNMQLVHAEDFTLNAVRASSSVNGTASAKGSGATFKLTGVSGYDSTNGGPLGYSSDSSANINGSITGLTNNTHASNSGRNYSANTGSYTVSTTGSGQNATATIAFTENHLVLDSAINYNHESALTGTDADFTNSAERANDVSSLTGRTAATLILAAVPRHLRSDFALPQDQVYGYVGANGATVTAANVDGTSTTLPKFTIAANSNTVGVLRKDREFTRFLTTTPVQNYHYTGSDIGQPVVGLTLQQVLDRINEGNYPNGTRSFQWQQSPNGNTQLYWKSVEFNTNTWISGNNNMTQMYGGIVGVKDITGANVEDKDKDVKLQSISANGTADAAGTGATLKITTLVEGRIKPGDYTLSNNVKQHNMLNNKNIDMATGQVRSTLTTGHTGAGKTDATVTTKTSTLKHLKQNATFNLTSAGDLETGDLSHNANGSNSTSTTGSGAKFVRNAALTEGLFRPGLTITSFTGNNNAIDTVNTNHLTNADKAVNKVLYSNAGGAQFKITQSVLGRLKDKDFTNFTTLGDTFSLSKIAGATDANGSLITNANKGLTNGNGTNYDDVTVHTTSTANGTNAVFKTTETASWGVIRSADYLSNDKVDTSVHPASTTVSGTSYGTDASITVQYTQGLLTGTPTIVQTGNVEITTKKNPNQSGRLDGSDANSATIRIVSSVRGRIKSGTTFTISDYDKQGWFDSASSAASTTNGSGTGAKFLKHVEVVGRFRKNVDIVLDSTDANQGWFSSASATAHKTDGATSTSGSGAKFNHSETILGRIKAGSEFYSFTGANTSTTNKSNGQTLAGTQTSQNGANATFDLSVAAGAVMAFERNDAQPVLYNGNQSANDTATTAISGSGSGLIVDVVLATAGSLKPATFPLSRFTGNNTLAHDDKKNGVQSATTTTNGTAASSGSGATLKITSATGIPDTFAQITNFSVDNDKQGAQIVEKKTSTSGTWPDNKTLTIEAVNGRLKAQTFPESRILGENITGFGENDANANKTVNAVLKDANGAAIEGRATGATVIAAQKRGGVHAITAPKTVYKISLDDTLSNLGSGSVSAGEEIVQGGTVKGYVAHSTNSSLSYLNVIFKDGQSLNTNQSFTVGNTTIQASEYSTVVQNGIARYGASSSGHFDGDQSVWGTKFNDISSGNVSTVATLTLTERAGVVVNGAVEDAGSLTGKSASQTASTTSEMTSTGTNLQLVTTVINGRMSSLRVLDDTENSGAKGWELSNNGSGYRLGDVRTIVGGNNDATIEVTQLASMNTSYKGPIADFKILTLGTGYTSGTEYSLNTGGAKIVWRGEIGISGGGGSKIIYRSVKNAVTAVKISNRGAGQTQSLSSVEQLSSSRSGQAGPGTGFVLPAMNVRTGIITSCIITDAGGHASMQTGNKSIEKPTAQSVAAELAFTVIEGVPQAITVTNGNTDAAANETILDSDANKNDKISVNLRVQTGVIAGLSLPADRSKTGARNVTNGALSGGSGTGAKASLVVQRGRILSIEALSNVAGEDELSAGTADADTAITRDGGSVNVSNDCTKPNITAAIKNGVITSVSLCDDAGSAQTTVGSGYVSKSNVVGEGGSGSGAKFHLAAMPRVFNLGNDTQGRFRFELDIADMTTAEQASLTNKEFVLFQAPHESIQSSMASLMSRSSKLNTLGLNYQHFGLSALADKHRTLYLDGGHHRTQATTAFGIAEGQTKRIHVAQVKSHASTTLAVAVSGLATYDNNAEDASSSPSVQVTPVLDSDELYLDVKGLATIDDLSLAKATITVTQTTSGDFHSQGTFVDRFDVVFHRVNDASFKKTGWLGALGAAAGEHAATKDTSESWTMWYTPDANNSAFKNAQNTLALYDLERGSGVYEVGFTGELLRVLRSSGADVDFFLGAPTQATRRLRDSTDAGVLKAVDLDLATALRRAAFEASSLTLRVGGNSRAVKCGKDVHVHRASTVGGTSVTINANATLNGNWVTVTTNAAHNLEVGDIAMLRNGANDRDLVVANKPNSTTLVMWDANVMNASSYNNMKVYNDRSILRVRMNTNAVAGACAKAEKLDLSQTNTNKDFRLFESAKTDDAVTVRMNKDAWATAIGCRHRETVRMVEYQGDDRSQIFNGTTPGVVVSVTQNRYLMGSDVSFQNGLTLQQVYDKITTKTYPTGAKSFAWQSNGTGASATGRVYWKSATFDANTWVNGNNNYAQMYGGGIGGNKSGASWEVEFANAALKDELVVIEQGNGASYKVWEAPITSADADKLTFTAPSDLADTRTTSTTVSLKGTAYSVGDVVFDTRMIEKPENLATSGIAKINEKEQGARLLTRVICPGPTSTYRNTLASDGFDNQWLTHTYHPAGPTGPLRDGSKDYVTLAITPAPATGITSSSANTSLSTTVFEVKYNANNGTSDIVFTDAVTAFMIADATRNLESPQGNAITVGTTTTHTVQRIPHATLTKNSNNSTAFEDNSNTVHMWENQAAEAVLLKSKLSNNAHAGSVRSVLNFNAYNSGSDAHPNARLRDVILRCDNFKTGGTDPGTGLNTHVIQQLDANDNVVAEGTMVGEVTRKAAYSLLGFRRDWGADFTAAAKTRIVDKADKTSIKLAAFTPANGSVIAHINAVENASTNTEYDIHTATGFEHLDYDQAAADTQDRKVKYQLFSNKADHHSNTVSNKRIITDEIMPLSVINKGSGYAVGDDIVLRTTGSANITQKIQVLEVHAVTGAVTRYRLDGEPAGTFAKTNVVYQKSTTGNGSGFRGTIRNADDAVHENMMVVRYTMDTRGLENTNDNNTVVGGPFKIRLQESGTETQYQKDTNGDVFVAGTSNDVPLNVEMNASLSSVSAIPGYDMDSQDYFSETPLTLKTYRDPSFELFDDATRNIAGGSVNSDFVSSDEEAPLNALGTGYSLRDILTGGDATNYIKVVVMETGDNDKITRARVIAKAGNPTGTLALVGGTGLGATLGTDGVNAPTNGNGVNVKIPVRVTHANKSTDNAQLAILAASSELPYTSTSATTRGPASGFTGSALNVVANENKRTVANITMDGLSQEWTASVQRENAAAKARYNASKTVAGELLDNNTSNAYACLRQVLRKVIALPTIQSDNPNHSMYIDEGYLVANQNIGKAFDVNVDNALSDEPCVVEVSFHTASGSLMRGTTFHTNKNSKPAVDITSISAGQRPVLVYHNTGPTNVQLDKSNADLTNGGNVTISVSGTRSNGSNTNALTYQWYKNGSAQSGMTSDSITLNANNNNTGVWVCRVTDSIGSTFSNTCAVKDTNNGKISDVTSDTLFSLTNSGYIVLRPDTFKFFNHILPYDLDVTFTVKVTDTRTTLNRTWRHAITDPVRLTTASASNSMTIRRLAKTGMQREVRGFGDSVLDSDTTKERKKLYQKLDIADHVVDVWSNTTLTLDQRAWNFTPSTGVGFGSSETDKYLAKYTYYQYKEDAQFAVTYDRTNKRISVMPTEAAKESMRRYDIADGNNIRFILECTRKLRNGNTGATTVAASDVTINSGSAASYSWPVVFQLTNAQHAKFCNTNIAKTETDVGHELTLNNPGGGYAKDDVISLQNVNDSKITVTRVHPETGEILAWEFHNNFTAVDHEAYEFGLENKATTTVSGSGSGATFDLRPGLHKNLFRICARILNDSAYDKEVNFRLQPNGSSHVALARDTYDRSETSYDPYVTFQNASRTVYTRRNQPYSINNDSPRDSFSIATSVTDGDGTNFEWKGLSTYEYAIQHKSGTTITKGTFGNTQVEAKRGYGNDYLTDRDGTSVTLKVIHTDRVNIANDVEAYFKHPNGNHTGKSLRNSSVWHNDTFLKDVNKRAHLYYINSLLGTNEFADYQLGGPMGDFHVELLYNTGQQGLNNSNLAVTQQSPGSGALKFGATPTAMTEAVGRTPVALTITSGKHDGPAGYARDRDAIFLAVDSGSTTESLNLRMSLLTIVNGGTQYKEGDVLTLTNTAQGANQAQVTVNLVNDATGEILSVSLDNANRGTKYAANTVYNTTTAGDGTGCTIRVVGRDSAGAIAAPFTNSSEMFLDISNDKTRMLDDALLDEYRSFNGNKDNAVFTEGGSVVAGSDFFLNHNGSLKAVGWNNPDSMPGLPSNQFSLELKDTGSNQNEIDFGFMNGNANNLSKVTSWDSGKYIKQANISTTEYIDNIEDWDTQSRDLKTISRSSENTFIVIDGRRVTGRVQSDADKYSEIVVNKVGATFKVTSGLRDQGIQYPITNAAISIDAGGSNYAADDLLFWAGAIVKVTSVDGNGAITGVNVERSGATTEAKNAGNGSDATGGTGSGAKFRISGTALTHSRAICLPPLGYKKRSGATASSAGVAAGINSTFPIELTMKTSKLKSTDSGFPELKRTHTITLNRVAALLETVRIADLHTNVLVAPKLVDPHLQDSNKRVYHKKQKLWASNYSKFLCLYVNGADPGPTQQDPTGTAQDTWKKSGAPLIINKGTGYAVGDVLSLTGSGQTSGAKATVRGVHSGGKLSTIEITAVGNNYNGGVYATSADSGSGSGATIRYYGTTKAEVWRSNSNLYGNLLSISLKQGNTFFGPNTGVRLKVLQENAAKAPYAFGLQIDLDGNRSGTSNQTTFMNNVGSKSVVFQLQPNGYTSNTTTDLTVPSDTFRLLDSTFSVNALGNEKNLQLDPDAYNAEGNTNQNDFALVKNGNSYQKAELDTLTLAGRDEGEHGESKHYESYQALTLSNQGSGYKVGEVLTIAGGNSNAKVTVTAIDNSGTPTANATGKINSFSITAVGTNYSRASGATTSSNGNGTGATFNIKRVHGGKIVGGFTTAYTDINYVTVNGNEMLAGEEWTLTNVNTRDLHTSPDSNNPETMWAPSTSDAMFTDAVIDELDGTKLDFMTETSVTTTNSEAKRTYYIAPSQTFNRTVLREANDVRAELGNFNRPMEFAETQPSGETKFESAEPEILRGGLDQNVHVEAVADGYFTKLKFQRAPTDLPRYTVMRKPAIAHDGANPANVSAVSDSTPVGGEVPSFKTELGKYDCTNCDSMLMFVDRSDIGGFNGTQHEDRVAGTLSYITTTTTTSATLDNAGYRNFNIKTTDLSAGSDVAAKATLELETKGDDTFYRLDTSTVRENDSATLAVSVGVGTITWNGHGASAGEFVTVSGATDSLNNGTFKIQSVATNTITYTAAGSNQGSATITATLGTANEVHRTLRVIGAATGKGIAANGLTCLTANVHTNHQNDTFTLAVPSTTGKNHGPQKITVKRVNGTLQGVTGDGMFNVATCYNVDVPTTSENIAFVNRGSGYSNGTQMMKLHDFTGAEKANIKVVVSGGEIQSVDSSAWQGGSNAPVNLPPRADYRIHSGDNKSCVVSVEHVVGAEFVNPTHASALQLVNVGEGYSANDEFYLDNPANTRPLGKERILIKVNSVNANGAIQTYTATLTSAEPLYVIDTLLVNASHIQNSVIAPSTQAQFKIRLTDSNGNAIAGPPRFRVSSSKFHPFYIYSEDEKTVGLQIVKSNNISVTEMGGELQTRYTRAHIDGTTVNNAQLGPSHYNQGDGRIRYTEALEGYTKPVTAGSTSQEIGDRYYVYIPKVKTLDNGGTQSNFERFWAETQADSTTYESATATHVMWAANNLNKKHKVVSGFVIDGGDGATTETIGGIVYAKITVMLQSTSDASVRFLPANGTRTKMTMLNVVSANSNASSIMHLTPFSREVHIHGLTLRTGNRVKFGDAEDADDLTHAYPTNKFNIASYIVRTTEELSQTNSVQWNPVGRQVTIALASLANLKSTTVDGLNVFNTSNNDYVQANARKTILAVNGKKHFLAFGKTSNLSGYYTYSSSNDATVTFTVMGSQWADNRVTSLPNSGSTVTYTDTQSIFIMPCQNSGSDWTCQDGMKAPATESGVNTLKFKTIGTRADAATLFENASAIDAVKTTNGVTTDSTADYSSSTSTLLHRGIHTKNNQTVTSDTRQRQLGTLSMYRDERRVYKIFEKKGIQRASDVRFKMVDLPTRLDARDVIITIIRSTDQTSMTPDRFAWGDIISMRQLRDTTGHVATSTIVSPNPTSIPWVNLKKPAETTASNNIAGNNTGSSQAVQTNTSLPYTIRSQTTDNDIFLTADGAMRVFDILTKNSFHTQDKNLKFSLLSDLRIKATCSTSSGVATVTANTNYKFGVEVGDEVIIRKTLAQLESSTTTGVTVEPASTDIVGVITAVNGAQSQIQVSTTQTWSGGCDVTIASRVRRVLNKNNEWVCQTPSWGYKVKQSQYNGPLGSVGTNLPGIVDDGSASQASDKPFAHTNNINIVPRNDVYNF